MRYRQLHRACCSWRQRGRQGRSIRWIGAQGGKADAQAAADRCEAAPRPDMTSRKEESVGAAAQVEKRNYRPPSSSSATPPFASYLTTRYDHQTSFRAALSCDSLGSTKGTDVTGWPPSQPPPPVGQ